MEHPTLVEALPSGRALKDCPNAQNKFNRAVLLVLAKPMCRGAVDSGIYEGVLVTENSLKALKIGLGITEDTLNLQLSFSTIKARFNDSKFDEMLKKKELPIYAIESAREFIKAVLSTAGILVFKK